MYIVAIKPEYQERGVIAIIMNALNRSAIDEAVKYSETNVELETNVKVMKNVWQFDPNISWYGPHFYGSGTACGQTYSKTIMGVAHRTLPCGTLVSFRNPANGRVVTVPVIDRGPYVAGRTWDMSKGLCTYLDHCYTGSIEWKLGKP